MAHTQITYTTKDKNGSVPVNKWRDSDANEVKTVVNAKADLNGPALVNPSGTTQSSGDNSINLATTAFVQDAKAASSPITKNSHGFTVGMAVYKDASDVYQRASAATAGNIATNVDGVVSHVIDTNKFRIATAGQTFDASSLSLTSGSTYCLAATGSGANHVISSSAPSTAGQVYKEIFRTSAAGTATVILGPALEIQNSSGGGGLSSITVKQDGSTVGTGTTLNFIGTGTTVADAGSGTINVTVNAGGGGGSSKMVSNTSFSCTNSSYLTININAYSSYKRVIIRFYNVTSSVAQDVLYMQASSDGSTYSTGSSDYKYGFGWGSGGSLNQIGTQVQVANEFSGNAGHESSGQMIFFNPSKSSAKTTFRWDFAHLTYDGGTHYNQVLSGAGFRNTVATTQAIRFFSNGGTITGTYEIWAE